jgi:hypothetical protein
MARKTKGVGYQVKVERVKANWFNVYGIICQTTKLLGCPMGRSWSEEAALADFVERVNSENRLAWTVKDLVVTERRDYVSK